MILNMERKPDYSLYYLGGVAYEVLAKEGPMKITELIDRIRERIRDNVYVDFIFFALDWLFILGLINVEEGVVHCENSEINY